MKELKSGAKKKKTEKEKALLRRSKE